MEKERKCEGDIIWDWIGILEDDLEVKPRLYNKEGLELIPKYLRARNKGVSNENGKTTQQKY